MSKPIPVKSFAALSGAAVLFCVLGPLAAPTAALSSGPPAGFTGAPTEANCTACHTSYAVNSGNASLSATVPLQFVPNSTNLVSIAFGNSNTPRHGFQITAHDGNDSPVGGWQAIQAGVTQNAFGSQYHHEHTILGVTQTSWQMNWLAPASLPNGPVTFYFAGNEANMSFTPDGDYIYTRRTKMYQATLTTATTQWPTGTVQSLAFNAPNHAGDLFLVAVSESPAVNNFGGPFDLECDLGTGLTWTALQLPTIFYNIFGVLNGAGQATSTITIPYAPQLTGLTLHFAGITADYFYNPTEVTNRVSVTFQ